MTNPLITVWLYMDKETDLVSWLTNVYGHREGPLEVGAGVGKVILN